MKLTSADLKWVEEFYADIEQAFAAIKKVYKRPADYIERATRVLYGNRKAVKNQFEGKRTGNNHE